MKKALENTHSQDLNVNIQMGPSQEGHEGSDQKNLMTNIRLNIIRRNRRNSLDNYTLRINYDEIYSYSEQYCTNEEFI